MIGMVFIDITEYAFEITAIGYFPLGEVWPIETYFILQEAEKKFRASYK